jgi:transcriptional regulator with XRE-family HTH domain
MTDRPSGATLGQQIRDARVAAGLSLRALARRLEVAPSYMNDIENDRRVPSEAVLRRIASEVGLDADLLLAAAGRAGEGQGARKYIREQPAAGVLFRRLSDARLDEQGLKLLEEAEKMITERDEDAGG